MSIDHIAIADQMRRLEIDNPPEQFQVDGKIHRFPVSGRHKDTCWYAFHFFRLDNGTEVVVGLFGDWRSGRGSKLDFDMPALSDEEKKRYAIEMREKKAAAAKAKAQKAAETAVRAAGIWEKLPDTGASDYLTRKKVKAFGLRFSRGSVVVPVRNFKYELVGLQFIQADGTKRFLTGTAKEGAFHFIGKMSRNESGQYQPLLIAEGYATAASLHGALDLPVVVCFDAGNLKSVAKLFRDKYPELEICICGDDDPFTKDNPGRTKAIETALAINAAWVVPGLNGETPIEQNTDFNDVLVDSGVPAIRDAVIDSLERFRLKNKPAQTAAAAEAQPDVGGVDYSDENLEPYFPDDESLDLDGYDDIEPYSEDDVVVSNLEHTTDQPTGEESLSAEETDDQDDKQAPPERDPYFEDRFLLTEKGQKKSCTYNYNLVFGNHADWQGMIGFCNFTYRIFKLQAAPWHGSQAGEWTDADTVNAKLWLGEEYEFTPSNADVYDAIVVTAKRNAFHPVRDYLNDLTWDGKSRLNTWLMDCLGAVGELEYLSIVGQRFLIGAVARVMCPPVKMDNVLILEGAQGIGKSTAVRHLFNDWSSESAIDLSNKDAYQAIQGVWGVELAELDSFNKAESTTAKNFFSVLEDRFRPPYGRVPESVPRQCVFIGTTNQDEYLKDYSGNRRYWPVMCSKANIEKIVAERDQLWAEAMHQWRNKERWWVEGAHEIELFNSVQECRLLSDPWEDAISQWLNMAENSFTDFFTSHEILIGAVKMDVGHIQRAHQNRIAPILKHLGWHGTRKRMKEGKSVRQVRGYERPLELRETKEGSIDAF